MREELSTRLNASDTMEIIKEKEEQIRGLLEEGKTCLLNMFFFTATNRWHNQHLVRQLLLLVTGYVITDYLASHIGFVKVSE